MTEQGQAETASISWVKQHSHGLRLFGLVFLTLYLELALIRFSSAEVYYLGYFSNYILMSAFLGIGLGFLAVKREVNLFRFMPLVLLALVSFLVFTRADVTSLGSSSGQLYFAAEQGTGILPVWFSLGIIFFCSVFLFASIAQETGRCFKHYPPIVAYSIDIAGSLAGIVLFTVHSFMGAPPLAWFIVILLLTLLLSVRYSVVMVLLVGVGLVGVLVMNMPDHYERWSPYQKIEVVKKDDHFVLKANGLGHQHLSQPSSKEPAYNYAYRLNRERRGGKPYESALVIGSGGGNDLSYALKHGVKRVDAVEIDPEIQAAGLKHHPAGPYKDPRVTVHINDGRTFLQHCPRRYDLIIYALPDSLALASSYASIRLESYLFTTESFKQARGCLSEDGVLVLYNFYRKQWLLQRLAAMLHDAFGHAPRAEIYSKEDAGLLAALAIGPNVKGNAIPSTLATAQRATDNWPFLYMEQRELSPMYLWLIAFFVGTALAGLLLAGRGNLGGFRQHGPFMLMGAAFLLLETKSIIQFSLLFGSTWLVNSMVFAAILVLVLAANWMVVKLRLSNPRWLFVLLLASIVLGYLLPISQLLRIDALPLRYAAATVVLLSPIFFANLVFGYLFKDTEHATDAFGWNILGAMFGGALEYTSVLIGYQNLSIIIAVLYSACAVWALSMLNRRAR